jgi:hypothetical protein
VKPALLSLFILCCSRDYAQYSRIKIDSGNKNDVSVTQKAADSSQRSIVDLSRSDGNKIKVNQTILDSTPAKKQNESKFEKIITNSSNIVTLLISIGTLVTVWLGIIFFRKRKIDADNGSHPIE